MLQVRYSYICCVKIVRQKHVLSTKLENLPTCEIPVYKSVQKLMNNERKDN